MKYFVKFEFPALLLIVNKATTRVFGNVNEDGLKRIIYIRELTEFIVSIFKFLEQKLGVGLVLTTTLTGCLLILKVSYIFK